MSGVWVPLRAGGQAASAAHRESTMIVNTSVLRRAPTKTHIGVKHIISNRSAILSELFIEAARILVDCSGMKGSTALTTHMQIQRYVRAAYAG